jgi:hypothetical protein
VSHRVLVLATAGAGGDFQPLVAATFALQGRGHEVFFVGDRSVERALHGVDVQAEVLPRELDLGPRLVAAIHDAVASTHGDFVAAGSVVRERMTSWAQDVSRPVAAIVREQAPAIIVTSLFGVEVLHAVAPNCPWAVVNSTFYVGPNPPRSLEEDFGPRLCSSSPTWCCTRRTRCSTSHSTVFLSITATSGRSASGSRPASSPRISWNQATRGRS